MSSILPALWWLFFWTSLGLCLGSFLNAVIYRLPRDKSVRNPVWSFCPACKHRIRWYDNLPIISFIMLHGRCRHCGVPISTRYVVIEASMAIIVLMLVDALFIGHVRVGISDSVFGLTDRLAYDWPILLAHVILFACLLCMSAIDLEHYWVDIRFTNFATIAGFALHTLWSPRHSAAWVRPFDSTSAVSLMAMVGLGVVWLLLICQPHVAPEKLGEEDDGDTDQPLSGEASPLRLPPPSLASPSRIAGWLSGAMLVALFVGLFLDEGMSFQLRHVGRGLMPLSLFFILIVWESAAERPADQLIVEAIHDERHLARRMVLSELGLLLPAIIFAVAGWWLSRRFAGPVGELLHHKVSVPGFLMFRDWTPLYGFATAASGYLIAGALGWAVRIVFTLGFGKEAFGAGDIHMMAAAGCVAGWPVVVLGFFLTCGLAMAGWILSLPFKRSRALPLGPWLSLSFLAVVVFYDSMIQWPVIQRAIYAVQVLILQNSQAVMIGDLP